MEIKFYTDRNGQVPVREFLDGLDVKMRQKMLRSIKALQDMGTSLRMPLSEALGDGIFELRAKVGTNITRVMYFFVVGNRAVLTHGFIKKTQKTYGMTTWNESKIREVSVMDDFDKYLGEQLNDPEFKKEWDSSEMEYQLMMMVLKARNEQNLTQSELAERTGIRQSNISRIEKGQALPSILTLSKIAHGLGKELQIKFV